jgi:hypothetical protein
LWQSFPADRVLLSEGGAVASQTDNERSLATTKTELTEGKHYSEVELLSQTVAGEYEQHLHRHQQAQLRPYRSILPQEMRVVCGNGV